MTCSHTGPLGCRHRARPGDLAYGRSALVVLAALPPCLGSRVKPGDDKEREFNCQTAEVARMSEATCGRQTSVIAPWLIRLGARRSGVSENPREGVRNALERSAAPAAPCVEVV